MTKRRFPGLESIHK